MDVVFLVLNIDMDYDLFLTISICVNGSDQSSSCIVFLYVIGLLLVSHLFPRCLNIGLGSYFSAVDRHSTCVHISWLYQSLGKLEFTTMLVLIAKCLLNYGTSFKQTDIKINIEFEFTPINPMPLISGS